MNKFIAVLILYCFTGFNCAYGYEFSKIKNVFSFFEEDFIGKANLKDIALESLEILTQFDKNLKIYYNQSKFYIYQNQQLISSIDLPKSSDDFSIWKSFVDDVLQVGLRHSDILFEKKELLETKLSQNLSQKFDRYSHIESFIKRDKPLSSYLNGNILYIHLSSFYKNASNDIKTLIKQQRALSGVIIDLRNNHGGYINEAIKTADLFLEEGIIAYSEDKNKKRRYYSAKKGDILQSKKLIILTNEQTASAAELLTIALSEQSRATVIGVRTFGKGTIQNVHSLNQDVLYVTCGYFYSPSGKSINGVGITPQICTGIGGSCTLSGGDSVFDKTFNTAINVIKNSLS